MTAYWDDALWCRLEEIDRRLWGAYCRHNQRDDTSETSVNLYETTSTRVTTHKTVKVISKHIPENNIKVNLKSTDYRDVDWIYLAQDRAQRGLICDNSQCPSRLYECAICTMRKTFKLNSDSGDSGSKDFKRGYGGAYGGVWRNLRLAEVWSKTVGLC
jgi:hypothetical protein